MTDFFLAVVFTGVLFAAFFFATGVLSMSTFERNERSLILYSVTERHDNGHVFVSR